MCRPPSTATSVKSGRLNAGSTAALPPPSTTERPRALQAYICDLETEKLELQRGLEKQSALVERLAGEHHDATSRFQAVADERSAFERDLKECRAVLAEQVRFTVLVCRAMHS